MSFQKGFQKKVISKVFTYKLIIDQVNVCRQFIHDFLIVSFDFNCDFFSAIAFVTVDILKHNSYFSSSKLRKNVIILPEMLKIVPVSYQISS